MPAVRDLNDFDIRDLIALTARFSCAWCGGVVFAPPYIEINNARGRVHANHWRAFRRDAERRFSKAEKALMMSR